MTNEQKEALEELYRRPLFEQFREVFWYAFFRNSVVGAVILGVPLAVTVLRGDLEIPLSQAVYLLLAGVVSIGLATACLPFAYFAVAKPYYLRKLEKLHDDP